MEKLMIVKGDPVMMAEYEKVIATMNIRYGYNGTSHKVRGKKVSTWELDNTLKRIASSIYDENHL